MEKKIHKTTVIVGGGIMGVSTAWYLSKNGFEHVTLLDSHKLPRPTGSASVDGNRAIRYSYGNDPGYTVMVSDAYKAWNEMFNDISDGKTLQVETGTLLIQSKENPDIEPDFNNTEIAPNYISDTIRILEKFDDILHTKGHFLTIEELEKWYPYLITDNIETAYYSATGGVLFAGDIVECAVNWLKKQSNVTVLEGPEYEVTEINVPNSIEININKENSNYGKDNSFGKASFKSSHSSSTSNSHSSCTTISGQVFNCDHLVVAAGIYFNKLIPSAEEYVFYSKNYANYYSNWDDEALEIWKTMPLIIDYNSTMSYYFLPNIGGTGTFGVKAGDRKFIKIHYEQDTDEDNGKADESTLWWIKKRFAPKLTDNIGLSGQKVCFHDFSKDNGKFIFYTFNEQATSVALFGFSGHGFKFGALTGKVVYDVLMGNKDVDKIKNWYAGKHPCLYDEL